MFWTDINNNRIVRGFLSGSTSTTVLVNSGLETPCM